MSFLGFLIFVGLSILFYKKTKLSILQSMGISIILSALVNFILNMLIFINFSILVILALMIVGAVYYIYKKTLSDWKKINPTINDVIDFSKEIENSSVEGDMIGEYIPVNRTEYFNMGTENNISEDVFPIIYNAQPAKNEMKFMEYGYLITTNEIVLNRQIRNKNSTDRKEKYTNEKINIPFQNLYKQYRIGKTSFLLYYDGPNLIVRDFPDTLSNKN